MKKIFLLTAVVILAACANNTSSKKPKVSEEEPTPVEAEAEKPEEPAQKAVQPLMQPVSTAVKADNNPVQKVVPQATEEAAPVKDAVVTVDALCQQFGVYDLFTQYDQFLKDGDKKSARKIEGQLSQLKKQVKANGALPDNLRENFKNYIDGKQEEIRSRY